MTSGDALQSSDANRGQVHDNARQISATKAIEEAKSLVSSIIGESVGAETLLQEASAIGVVSSSWMTTQDEALETSEQSSSTAPEAAQVTIPTAGLGRGRGNVSNLPAWMTESSAAGAPSSAPTDGGAKFADADETSPAKRVGSNNEEEEEGRPNKKAKLETKDFEFTLKVTLDPAKLPDFIASFRSTIEEAGTRGGGSAKLERVD
jgi:hypothetical protein